MRPLIILLLLGCANAPYCAGTDATGRGLIFCSSMDQAPVCDSPGVRAQFQEREGEVVLINGEDAHCDDDGVVVCPPGTMGDPYCLDVPRI